MVIEISLRDDGVKPLNLFEVIKFKRGVYFIICEKQNDMLNALRSTNDGRVNFPSVIVF